MTIFEVADNMKLSARTISRALNDSPLVSAATKKRIFAYFDHIGYTPNAAARSLVRKKTDVIGIVASSSRSLYLLDLIVSMEDELANRGKQVAMFLTNGREDELQTVKALRAKSVDGLICLSAYCTDAEIREIATANPNIIFGQGPAEFQPVNTNHFDGIRTLLQFLIGHGHRHIHLLSVPATMFPGRNERQEAYVQVMQASGLADCAKIWPVALTMAEAYEAARDIFARRDRPSALMCFNDEAAFGALHAAYELGLDIPGKVSITGFDGVALGAFTNPALTTFKINTREVARAMVSRLLRRVDNPGDRTVIPPEIITGAFIPGGSTGPAPKC